MYLSSGIVLIPELFSGINTIPEKNKKNFRYCIDTGKEF